MIMVITVGAAIAPYGPVWWTVVALVAAAFVGAWAIARRTSSRGAGDPAAGSIEAPVVSTDLLDPYEGAKREPKIVRVFEIALLVVLAGYAFFDRGFAWLHVPGTPLFVGELILVLGALAILSYPTPLLDAVRRSPPMKLLGILMLWGLGLLLLLGLGYGVDAIRDSAIWYYGVVALFAVFLLVSNPPRIQRWLAMFARILPWLIGWLFVAVILDAMFGGGPPFVPDSAVSIFSHRAGNTGVILVFGLAFVWLVDRKSFYFTPSQRIAITAASGVLLLLVGLKNRGGLVAGGLGIIAILILMNRRRSELVVTLVGVSVFLAAVALVSQVNIPLFGEREVSAEQFVSNVTSIVSPESGSERETSTTRWRIELWTRVLDDVNSEFPITGYGPGPDLGEIYNVTTNEEVPLRNPHNSHVGVVARLGWVGLGIWVVMWGVWALLLLDLRTRLARLGRPDEAGLIAVLLIGAGMILINAFFDPTLEGPQVGMWLWFIFGSGAALQLFYHGFPSLATAHESATGIEAGFATTDTLDQGTE